MAYGPLARLSEIVPARSRRVSSYDRSGGNADFVRVEPGETFTLAEIGGAGIVKHLWFTLGTNDPLATRNLVLRAYWDGQAHPSIESPIGDFFGQGWALNYNFASLPLAAAPKEGRALVCYFPMPFGNGARLTLENQGETPLNNLYYYVDYESHAEIAPTQGRFHAQYRQELTVPECGTGDVENEWGVLGETPKHPSDNGNFVFCDAEGEGHFVGLNYYVNSPGPIWYGEGDDMFLVDGEPWPGSAHGTGTEDYFNTSWSPEERYDHPYFGLARVPGVDNNSPRFGWLGRTHLYRFHVEDPIRFTKSLRASIEHGHDNCLALELATVAYWYQTLPSKPFLPLPAAKDRRPRDEVGAVDVHRWRDAWRRAKGGGPLWGNES